MQKELISVLCDFKIVLKILKKGELLSLDQNLKFSLNDNSSTREILFINKFYIRKPNNVLPTDIPYRMDRIGRYEFPLSDLRTLHHAFNLRLYLSFREDHQFIGPVDKVS